MNVKCVREIEEEDDKVKRVFECLRACRFDRCDLNYCFLIFVFYLINNIDVGSTQSRFYMGF